jgi:SAM-dependent methyltransferase
MNDAQRAAVRDNARYLRNVRPLDPEEIATYVEGGPHPAAVRQVLRELAPELALVEREDGTFVPVDEEPLSPRTPTVERFPERYARVLEDRLVERFGPDWHAGTSGDRLRERLRTVKEHYLHGSAVEYDDLTALAYAIYHLPDYYAAVQYPLDTLAADGLLGRSLRVLDVGAGTGGPALGLADYVTASDDAILEYHAVEPSPAADLLADLLGATDRNIHPTVHRETAEGFTPAGEYDLLVFANVLSELDDPVAVLERYRECLAPDGTLLALAPADRETSIALRATERAIEDGYTIYGPTVRLWPGERPTDECWAFDVRPDIETPAFQRRLDAAAGGTGEFCNTDVQFSHFLARRDGHRRVAFDPDPERWARMADMDAHVTNRIDVLGAKLSHSLADAGNPVYKLSDGSEATAHFAVLVDETTLNEAFRTAAYGTVLAVENTLVLWNDDEEAYNLVVDDETVVDVI